MNTLTLPDHVVVQRKTIRTKFLLILGFSFLSVIVIVGTSAYSYLRGIDSGKTFEARKTRFHAPDHTC